MLPILQRLDGSKEQEESNATVIAEQDCDSFEPKDTFSGNQLRSLTLANQKNSDSLLDWSDFARSPHQNSS